MMGITIIMDAFCRTGALLRGLPDDPRGSWPRTLGHLDTREGLRMGRRLREGGEQAASPSLHRRDCWGDGAEGELKCSMTQIQLFYFRASAEAESRLDYHEVLLICTER